ncbi:MAG TPA: sigma-70 family RNA polymerase sigma factor [Acidimicrobiales bacterium]|nr:sigma-70 family RNA polymerase sigma factor [Acidimicrobiales bacterium]
MEDVEEHEDGRDDALPRFQEIYEGHYAAVYAYARRRTLVDADAQDAVAETFTIAWRRVGEMPAGDAARAWLYGVARRVLANQRRGDRRRASLSVRLRGQDAATIEIEGDVLAADDRRIVLAALGRLREADRELLRLAVWEELPHREIAAVVGCSEGSVAVRLHRARGRLAREIGKEERRAGQEATEDPERRAEGSTS